MSRPRKRFGQHFLEPAWRDRVVAACAPAPDDQTVEIGPGRGAITLPLAATVGRLLAIEVDRDLAAALTARALPNVTVHTGDVLGADVDSILASWLATGAANRRFRVVGNLPYNVSSPILFRLAHWRATHAGFTDATVMLQAEVADRLAARPGTREYGVLTVLTALWADVTRVLELPPGAFRPAPDVRSALIRLVGRPPSPEVRHPAMVDRLVRVVFTQRRKTLANGLKPVATSDGVDAAAVLRAAGIDGMRRPETLHLVEFSALADAWQAASVL
jgi:16S rRNA (adenine1518-N6/adenine1519-N6)-dimethyltransferase